MEVSIPHEMGSDWSSILLKNNVKNCLILNAEVDTLLLKVLSARCYMKLKLLSNKGMFMISHEVDGDY